MKLIKENGEVFYQVVVVLYQEQLYGQYIKDVGLHGAVSLVPWEIEFPRNPEILRSEQ